MATCVIFAELSSLSVCHSPAPIIIGTSEEYNADASYLSTASGINYDKANQDSWQMLNSEQEDEECDATKMIVAMQLINK
ncbi:MAG: hypothetical protein WDN26_21070 [Chitinophagaceae bacterium]